MVNSLAADLFTVPRLPPEKCALGTPKITRARLVLRELVLFKGAIQSAGREIRTGHLNTRDPTRVDVAFDRPSMTRFADLIRSFQSPEC